MSSNAFQNCELVMVVWRSGVSGGCGWVTVGLFVVFRDFSNTQLSNFSAIESGLSGFHEVDTL